VDVGGDSPTYRRHSLEEQSSGTFPGSPGYTRRGSGGDSSEYSTRLSSASKEEEGGSSDNVATPGQEKDEDGWPSMEATPSNRSLLSSSLSNNSRGRLHSSPAELLGNVSPL